jgi:ribose-phosphate pyrophosphokinase
MEVKQYKRRSIMVSINGTTIGNDCFPNNERVLNSVNFNTKNYDIEFKYQTDIDISILIMAKKYLDDKFNNPKVTLIMKYVPYSRMDRNIEGYMFSLKYFCQLINDLKFDRVLILDPHSNVTTALLDRCTEIKMQDNVYKILSSVAIDYVFYPDNGAMKRYSEILKTQRPYFYGNKKRNLQTGEIISYELVDCPDIQNKDILIIDDLCAKGFTFYNSAQKLKECGANEIFLYVSHCENSIYNGKLLKSGLITRIFTTDSILNDWSSNLIYNIEKI